MPKVIFASHVQRHVLAPDTIVEGATVRANDHMHRNNKRTHRFSPPLNEECQVLLSRMDP